MAFIRYLHLILSMCRESPVCLQVQDTVYDKFAAVEGKRFDAAIHGMTWEAPAQTGCGSTKAGKNKRHGRICGGERASRPPQLTR